MVGTRCPPLQGLLPTSGIAAAPEPASAMRAQHPARVTESEEVVATTTG